jgi:hypothetical protein
MKLCAAWRRPLWLVVCLPLVGVVLALVACAPQAVGTQPTSTAAPQGTLTGDVVAGPTCPVQQAESPCPPEPVPDREVMVKTSDGTVVAKTTTDAQGHFRVSVAPGNYVVDVSSGSAPWPRQTEVVHVTVVAGQVAYVKIELDTGIR